MNIEGHISTPTHGILGSMTSVLAVIISFLPHLEAWLRVSSLAFGTLAAIVSIFIMLEKRKLEKEKYNEKHNR
jgi:hypothetical protein